MAHVGDSGAFCIRDRAARRLTIDHKPTNPAEQKRIANAGGKVKIKQAEILSSLLGVEKFSARLPEEAAGKPAHEFYE